MKRCEACWKRKPLENFIPRQRSDRSRRKIHYTKSCHECLDRPDYPNYLTRQKKLRKKNAYAMLRAQNTEGVTVFRPGDPGFEPRAAACTPITAIDADQLPQDEMFVPQVWGVL